ncbi:MAG: hypothetical protein GEU78_14795 [Actinobacteria bacterium]|nr:hypothetical protein [Actinomycetota bacterium]
MSSPDPAAAVGIDAVGLEDVVRCHATLVRALEQDSLESLPSEAIIRLLAASVRAYAAKAQQEPELPAFHDDDHVTATDVVVTVWGLIKAADLQLFELSMWNGLSRS